MLKRFVLPAVAALGLIGATAASATSFTFDFKAQGNQTADSAYGQYIPVTGVVVPPQATPATGLSVMVYGGHITDTSKTTGNVTYAKAAVWSTYGLGVLYANDNGNDGTHQIDNVGNDGVDFVALQFSQSVNVTTLSRVGYTMNGVTPDTDLSFVAYSGSLMDLMGGVNTGTFTTINDSATATGSSALSSIWLVSAAVGSSNRNDGFKLTTMIANTQSFAVPEPSTWAMMIVGFGAIGVSLRRRRLPALRAIPLA